MAQDLQQLIERIRADGVEKANAEAESIRAQAREDAARTVHEAEEKAKAMLARAKHDAAQFEARSRTALEQAARDLLLNLEHAIARALEAVIRDRVGGALDIETLKQMLVRIVDAYCSRQGQCDEIDMLVPVEMQGAIAHYFLSEFRSALDKGAEIHADLSLTRGFRIELSHEHVRHDFTQDAIAEAMSRLLRPKLAEIVRAAVADAPPSAQA